MSLVRLVIRSLFYHWRGNLAVLLGVVVGTAVLTGALHVGDSLRGSLLELSEQQLGWVDHALVANRFLREELANEVGAKRACPAILLRGTAGLIADQSSGTETRRVGRVVVLGVDDRFWPDASPPLDAAYWKRDDAEAGVVLNATLARDLGVKAGDRVVFHLQRVRPVANEWLLGQEKTPDADPEAPSREKVVDELRWTVRAVIDDDTPGARFSLIPSPATPRNALVPLRQLQKQLRELEGHSALPRPINAIFTSGTPTQELQGRLESHLTLDDWGLILLDPETRANRLDRDGTGIIKPSAWRNRVPRALAALADKDNTLHRQTVIDYYRRLGYFSLESRRQLIDPTLTRAALAAAERSNLRAAPTLVYVANSIAADGREVPYSIVAALNPSEPPPLARSCPKASIGSTTTESSSSTGSSGSDLYLLLEEARSL